MNQAHTCTRVRSYYREVSCMRLFYIGDDLWIIRKLYI